MRQFWSDLRTGFRSLWQYKLISSLAIVSLALAIAGNSVIFSISSSMFLRPLPFEDPEDMIFLGNRDPSKTLGLLIESKDNFLDLRNDSTSFEKLIAFTIPTLGLEGDGEPQPVTTCLVSEGFFDAVRWKASIGRLPLPEEEAPGAARVAVLSQRFWESNFASDPAIVGTDLELSGEHFEIVGVLPATAEFITPSLDLFSPLRPDPAEDTRRDQRNLRIFGRLAEGVTLADADHEIEALSKRLGVPKNYMFIGTPGDRFPHKIAELGGVRLVM